MAMITVYDEERPGLHVATAKESGRGYDLVQYGSETCCKSLGECMFISTRGRVLLRGCYYIVVVSFRALH